MIASVADIINVMRKIAPPYLAEHWDNPGLQVGCKEWPVKTVWISLDPAYDVVEAACNQGADMLITHHPLIFNPLRSVDLSSPIGSIIQLAVHHHLSIYSAHTNLDSAKGGVNDILSSMLGLEETYSLVKRSDSEQYHLVIITSAGAQCTIAASLNDMAAGKTELKTWRIFSEYKSDSIPRAPGSGGGGGIEKTIYPVNKIRIEVVLLRKDIQRCLDQIKRDLKEQNLSEDDLSWEVYPACSYDEHQGLGRVGSLQRPVTLEAFAQRIKTILGLPFVKVSGKPDLMIHKAALCSGSGSSLMKDFLSSGAQVFVSGDLRYHDARMVEDAHLGLIDIGHFNSEIVVVEALARRLSKHLTAAGFNQIRIKACSIEKEPFSLV
ncbi:MAG: Nif3-like dinuclear metal center hexameric protein [Desulfobacterales bacterium]|nr:Nif3-like dinuclear metal center hexameric protein [Desulfobacterales bacterium]MDD4071805.1 Nif3-like dinuclear metal center hexameric protein [Desulfobacterales bacterium]MDD4393397.1 Nif3-like dinuclear metal center hexameric protein [Desulfobacterales bacterium]